MPRSARVFLITSKSMIDIGREELSELHHEVVLTACSLEEALAQTLMIDELAANVAVIDVDLLSAEDAEKVAAAVEKFLRDTIIISWSTSRREFPWAKYHATKASASGKAPSLAMMVSLAS